ncbi:1-aminocyclopropane-1-carboxylate synthase-like protein 1 isoform X3 [Hippocampus comes]|uniref:1-aminocyclopropane-1-carboxylate synthase-like protein 1 isoform X3 n=1 Tax=Hippocampus comes TaxID=109280 RepID=UPI00094E84C4|nr:PREDICTED: 1-aminocyclopropane-1-carboxylate synthase-like protein 1 isoform X3 [Hippocampus comes]
MDPHCRRHERGSNWTDQEIVELLQLWSEDSIQIELESSLRNQRVFDRIALILREKGMFRTGNVPVPHDTSQESLPSPAATKQRRRRKAGKTVCGHGGGKCCSQGPLNKALANLLVWQQCAEDRLLSWEEARLEKELQADERRQQQEEKRAERERQHEMHLFNMLTGALTAVRQGATTTETAPTNTAVSLLDHQSAFLATSTASSAPSSSQPHTQAPSALAVSTKATMKSELHPSVKTCTSSESVLATVRGAKSPEASVYLSNRGNSIRQQQGILQAGFAHYGANRYDIDNPNGVINLGTSENKLCYDLLHKRLTRSDMLHVDPALLQYGDWRGHTFLREAVAEFLTHYCHSPKLLKADNVVVMNGCSALFSCIAAVICDPKDAILIPSPFYGAITEDVQLYSDVKLFHAPLESEDGNEDGRLFHLTVSKLEEAMQRAKQEGVNIRAIILVNPHNPLAEIYTPNEMLSFLQFAKRNEIHAIIDEVYMLTVFDESVTFHSVLSLESLPDPQRTHIMWGLSKDFAMAGNRIGTLYTENQDLVEALTKLGSFHGVTGTSQHQVAQLLQDREWISKEFLPENRRRLKAAHRYLTDELQTMDIHYLDSSATLYVWADFRKFLRSPSFEEELYMWRCFLKHNVVLSCGQAFSCCTPGWFRIVFADQQDHLQLGLKRIREALKEIKESSTNRDFFIVKEASEESERPVNEDSAPSDNATIENSTSSPQSKSSDQLKEKACSVLDTSSLGPDELVLLDCQAAKPAESLDTLIGTLKHQIRSSDWLEKNTPERSAGEDPEILDVFQTLLAQARK